MSLYPKRYNLEVVIPPTGFVVKPTFSDGKLIAVSCGFVSFGGMM